MKQSHSQHALPPGTMIQEYRLDSVVGQGSFGIVYLAKNQLLPETVAIKEFLPNEMAERSEGSRVIPKSADYEAMYQEVLHKFLQEARTLFELAQPQPHRNIIRVTRYIEANGTGYMVMDYEQGETLAEKLKGSQGTLPESELSAILFPLLDGLETVHAASITHRDIKPGNILIRPDGSPLLIDFGTALRKRPDGQKTQFPVFTPNYAAPEQYFDIGEQGPWTDIYALGATLYRAVTGTIPTNASARLGGKDYHLTVDAADESYSKSFLSAIDKALALQPHDRPQSVGEWRALFGPRHALHDVLSVVGLSDKFVSPTHATTTSPTPRQRRRRLVVWLSLLGLTGVAVAAFFFWRVIGIDSPHAVTATPHADTVLAPTADFSSLSVPTVPAESTITPTVDTSTIPASALPAEPTLDLAAIRAEVERLSMELGCAQVQPELVADDRLLLSGFVASQQDRERIRTGVAGLPGVREVVEDLVVHPQPFCQVIELLTAFQVEEASADDAVILRMNNPDNDYQEGELLVVQATASAAFNGYLYVDFFDTTGDVVHMLPSPIAKENEVQAGQQVILGNQSCPNCYVISPPHGRSLILAISSASPLFDSTRPKVENLNDYLTSLRVGLERQHAEGGNIISAFEYITTHE